MEDDELRTWLQETAEELGKDDAAWQKLRLKLAACVSVADPSAVYRRKGKNGEVVSYGRDQTAERTLGEMARAVAKLHAHIEARRAELEKRG